MQYSSEIIINLPRERVVELFDDGDSVKEWQPTLVEMEVISGEPGTVGSKTKLIYDEAGRKLTMIETLLERNLPESMTMTFEVKGLLGVWNKVHNTFEKIDNGKTRWVMENEFRFGGLMAILARLKPSAFPEQTEKSMKNFKKFAEKRRPK